MIAQTVIATAIADELRRLADIGEIELYPAEGEEHAFVIDGQVDINLLSEKVALALLNAGHKIGPVLSVQTEKLRIEAGLKWAPIEDELWLVPGAIDQYISPETFKLLFPGEIPAATKPAK